jgi:NAD(P)-dependent dehydrogenase (short-subunit alcohol dehydrogenase family)
VGALAGQVAVVTGAALGLGRQYAAALAREGCHLAICDLRPEVEKVADDLRGFGSRVMAHVADVSDPSVARRVVDGAAERFGGIDILISNAGVWRGGDPADPIGKSLEDYDALIGTNLKGVFLFGRAVIPHMIAGGGGHIINIATDHIHTHPGRPTGGGGGMDLYDVSKWGVLGLTLTWAKALSPRNIRVNCFSMGATDSNMLRGFYNFAPPDEAVADWMRPKDVCDLAIQMIMEGPHGRSGENIGIWVGFDIELTPVPPAKPAPVRI